MRDLDQGSAGTEKRAGAVWREAAARYVQMETGGGKWWRPGGARGCSPASAAVAELGAGWVAPG